MSWVVHGFAYDGCWSRASLINRDCLANLTENEVSHVL